MSVHSLSCWSCGQVWEFLPPVGRGESCPKCRRDGRVCRNCRFYDEGAYRSCAESQSEWVKDKEQANFCSWFETRGAVAHVTQHSQDNPLDKLFGGATPQVASQQSKFADDLEAFFQKKS